MSQTTRDALIAVTGVSTAFQDAVRAIYDRGQDIEGSFFTQHPELKSLYDDYVGSPASVAIKRAALLSAFSPILAAQRKRQLILQRMSTAARVYLEFAQTMLDPVARPWALHAKGHADQPAITDALALETSGLRAQFSDTSTGTAIGSKPADALISYGTGTGNPLPDNSVNAGDAISVNWAGQMEAAEDGYYNLIVDADSVASVKLTLAQADVTLERNGTIFRNADAISFKAGTLYDITIAVDGVKDHVSLKWETPKRGRESIPGRYLYPPTIMKPFSDLYVRFFKLASLAVALSLSADELAHFSGASEGDTDYAIGGDSWCNVLPVDDSADQTIFPALLRVFLALLKFSAIKVVLSPGDDAVLRCLEDPVTAGAEGGQLLALTHWTVSALSGGGGMLAHFGLALADLKRFEQFWRVYDAMGISQVMGVAASALIAVTTNDPTPEMVLALQAALRGRYDDAAWRDVVKPINDALRGAQRDALVAYILHQMSFDPSNDTIDTPDKLFEYFLMDVEMEPCMQTSRVRHALSSVQLFTERCLMNLDPEVSSSLDEAQQWPWRKRYRVWEANRRVFLFPENWLEPELRDDKSPFFKDIESQLLQSDITEDGAVAALLDYLIKLEEVAKLEPCGICHDVGSDVDTDHVIARTAGAHRKYYYRRHEYIAPPPGSGPPSGTWTPWEQIKLDIEDNPVMPVLWQGRLLLFWLRIMKHGPDTSGKPTASVKLTELTTGEISDDPHVKVSAMLCWSEYLNGKWQATKTSDVNRPTLLDSASTTAFDRSQLQLAFSQAETSVGTGVELHILIRGFGSSSFIMHNTHSLPVRKEDLPTGTIVPVPDMTNPFAREVHAAAKSLEVTYSNHHLPKGVLANGLGSYFDVTVQRDADIDAYVARLVAKEPRGVQELGFGDVSPFFFGDSAHAFYVTTSAYQLPIFWYSLYGVVNLEIAAKELPQLVLNYFPEEIRRDFWADGIPPSLNPGIADAGAVRRFITEDAYIRRGIATSASVTYGDVQIGPGGAMPNANRSSK